MAARQEVLNVHLASILSKLGFPTQAERKRHYAPDIIISHHYLGVLLGEAEIGSAWDDRTAREKLRDRTAERFRQPQFDYIDFVVLMVYPKKFIQQISTQSEDRVEEELARAEIGFGLAYRRDGADSCALRWCQTPINVTQVPSELEEMAKDIVGLTSEEVTKDLIETIEEAGRTVPSIKEMRKALLAKAVELDIDPAVFENEDDCIVLAVKTMFTLGGVALLVYELARLRHPLELHDMSPLNMSKLLEGMKRLRQINYVEIIDSAIRAWSDLPSHPNLNQLLGALYSQIKKGIDIIRRGGWDVLAFIYQRLLSETYRKAYATFYTKLPAAYLLANLAIESENDKVIDPACGTGSLLVSTFFIKKRAALSPSKVDDLLAKRLEGPILDQINKDLLGDLYGLDALKTAVSLSSGALTLASLAVPRGRLKLLNAPVGPEKSGSLDLLRMSVIKSDNGGLTLKTKAEGKDEKIENLFDVVIMNPPFTRSDRVPALVGNRARDDLNNLKLAFGKVKVTNLFVAGLAKPFLVLAGRLCRDDGRIALVLPNSILSRDAWADIRRGIVNSYAIEYIIVSYAPGVPNFSSDTQFREILLVLRKRKKGSAKIQTEIVNLFVSIDDLKLHEVDALAYSIKARKKGIIFPGKKQPLIATTKEFNWDRVENLVDNWYRLVAFKNLDLTEHHLDIVEKYCTPLKTFFSPGSVVDHTSGFEVLEHAPPGEYYDAVWGSGEKTGITTLQATPQRFIVITSKSDVKCRLWEKEYASNLMILRRGQLDTQYALMFELDRKAVSNVWWPLHTSKKVKKEHITAIVTFVNSILGIVHMLGERLETRGLWMEFKKGQLMKLPIPDFRRLSPKQLSGVFEENGLTEVTFASLPNVRDYVTKMANLEATLGNHKAAIEEALKDPLIKPRAILDKISIELLSSLGCETVPERMYQLVSEEIECLRKIMEADVGKARVVRDKGAEAIKEINDKHQRKLEEYSG